VGAWWPLCVLSVALALFVAGPLIAARRSVDQRTALGRRLD